MGRQRPVHVLDIKNRVRLRDRNMCVACHVSNNTQRKRYGKILEVHRLIPGSDYSNTWGVCVTLCNLCHDALHGQGNWGWVMSESFQSESDLEYRLWNTNDKDVDSEREWRKRESWGNSLQIRRFAKYGKGLKGLSAISLHTNIDIREIDAFECGRSTPTLFQAKHLAKALAISLDDLAEEDRVPDAAWMVACKDQ